MVSVDPQGDDDHPAGDTATEHASNGHDAPHHNVGAIVALCADEEVRDVIAYWLASEPAKTLIAEDGYQAAHALNDGCRWLVTDRVLPPLPGLDTFLTLRSQHPELRIAFVEENANVHDGILAKVTGASVLPPRPLSRRTISEALANGHG